LMIEISALQGSRLEVRYHGAPYYLNLRALPRTRWVPGYQLELPRLGPPLPTSRGGEMRFVPDGKCAVCLAEIRRSLRDGARHISSSRG
jgi:hypothetical protein